MQGPGRNPRYDSRGWKSDLRRRESRRQQRQAEAAAAAYRQETGRGTTEPDAYQIYATEVGQEIARKVHYHCLATSCIGVGVQAAYLVAALNYKSMGYTLDESVRLAFAQSGTGIARQEPASTTTITSSQPLQKAEPRALKQEHRKDEKTF